MAGDETPTWSLEEARAYLPRLRVMLDVLSRASRISSRARGNGHAAADEPVSAAAGGNDAPNPEQEEPTPGLGSEMLTPRAVLEELSERGVILRDPSRGLVDFPSLHPSGRVVLLCWLMGEEDIGWWHLPEDGFAGRRPLPVPPEL